MARHDQYTSQILTEIDAGRTVTQRELSRRLDIAPGLTNLLVRRVIQKGWVEMTPAASLAQRAETASFSGLRR